jgi:ribosome recycling factor
MSHRVVVDAEARMKKALEAARAEFGSVRTGKASPGLLEPVRVEAYGTQMPLNQVASISAPEPRLLVVQPFDKGLLEAIGKAIQKSGLGLNPSSDGTLLRLPIPTLTEERRREMVKLVKKMAEDGKVALRNVRRDANDEVRRLEKNGEMSEDDSHRTLDDVQKMTDRYVALLDEAATKKEKEVLEV